MANLNKRRDGLFRRRLSVRAKLRAGYENPNVWMFSD